MIENRATLGALVACCAMAFATPAAHSAEARAATVQTAPARAATVQAAPVRAATPAPSNAKRLAPAPGAARYKCTTENNHTECVCKGMLDCGALIKSGDCKGGTPWEDPDDPSIGGCG